MTFEDNEERIIENVLIYLTAYPKQVFTKQQIHEAVWREDSDSCFSVVVNTISHLRGKIEADRKNPVYVKTVYDGYMFDMKKTDNRKL